VGEVRGVNDGWAEIETKNKFSVGDRIEIIHPSGNRIVTLEQMKDKNGASIDVAAGSPTHVWIPYPSLDSSQHVLIAKLLGADAPSA
jgi:putative protease